jgi:membrane protein implicated in regulation of membrane protease activity
MAHAGFVDTHRGWLFSRGGVWYSRGRLMVGPVASARPGGARGKGEAHQRAEFVVTVSTWVKYLLFQVPGWLIAVVVLLVLRVWIDLPVKIAVILFILWVVKDLLFYPLLRIAYQSGPKTVVEQLFGMKGVVREPLDPDGTVFVRGELWRAKTEIKAGPITAGSDVRVVRAEGMTLIVAAENGPATVIGDRHGT